MNPKLAAIFKKIAATPIGARKATCGACGFERDVGPYMKRHAQYTPRPTEVTDSFYCGCQDQSDDPWWTGA
jgi:hypothetical protein